MTEPVLPRDQFMETDQPQRVILLGASNLARGCHTLLQTIRGMFAGPIEVWAAWGRGRSYGMRSRFLFKTLPGIIESPMWGELSRRPGGATWGMITDIGNDLLYGRTADQIAGWVETCLARLASMGSRTLLTRLPMASIEKLSPARFEFFRQLLFPSRPVVMAEILAAARRLDARLIELGAQYGARVVTQRGEWYGLDPIHLKMSRWKRAWREICAAWDPPKNAFFPVKSSLTRWLRMQTLPAAQSEWRGAARSSAQPVWRMENALSLSLY